MSGVNTAGLVFLLCGERRLAMEFSSIFLLSFLYVFIQHSVDLRLVSLVQY